MQLAEFQEKFRDTMFRPAADLRESAHDFDGLFRCGDIPLHARLKVYHNNVIGSLCTALRATFPLIENLTGEDFFKTMARTFIFAHPPQSGCLQDYGAGFDDFLRQYEPAASLPYLPDMAVLEFALNTAYYAVDDIPLPADALARVPPGDLADVTLQLRASATLIVSHWPLAEIRAFCMDEDNNTAPDMTKNETYRMLIHRPKLAVTLTPLAADAFMILALLRQKTPLGAAVEQTLEQYPDFDFTAFLQKHTGLETFAMPEANI